MTLNAFQVIGFLLFIVAALVLLTMMITRRPRRMDEIHHYAKMSNNK